MPEQKQQGIVSAGPQPASRLVAAIDTSSLQLVLYQPPLRSSPSPGSTPAAIYPIPLSEQSCEQRTNQEICRPLLEPGHPTSLEHRASEQQESMSNHKISTPGQQVLIEPQVGYAQENLHTMSQFRTPGKVMSLDSCAREICRRLQAGRKALSLLEILASPQLLTLEILDQKTHAVLGPTLRCLVEYDSNAYFCIVRERKAKEFGWRPSLDFSTRVTIKMRSGEILKPIGKFKMLARCNKTGALVNELCYVVPEASLPLAECVLRREHITTKYLECTSPPFFCRTLSESREFVTSNNRS